jgi:acyl-CoA reductase-like NAD-dependent aldehyde dehydrogenase
MTATATEPAAPEPQPPAQPQQPQQPAPETPPDGTPAPDVERLTTALERERSEHRATAQRLAEMQQQQMSDSERAVAAAREEGRVAALTEAGARMAAAEFRALAAGKLADPDAALEVLDLTKFVKDGEPDRAGLAAIIERLAQAAPAPTAPPPPPGGHVPAGPRQSQPRSDDFLRTQLAGGRGRR